MFPLWGRKEKKSLIKSTKPSPEHQGNHEDSAQNPDDPMLGGKGGLPAAPCFIEGTSPFTLSLLRERIFGTREKNRTFRQMNAGMTVEASILLPLFLFVFMNLGCAIEMIRLHGNLGLALWQIGRELSLYGYVLESGVDPGKEGQEDSWWKDLGEIVFAATYVKNKLVQLTGKDYLDASPLTKGARGLALWESDLLREGDIMDIVITYSVSPWIGMTGISDFRMANRYYAHIWNGYRLPDGAGEDAQAQVVYVTENASVYHLSRSCTHLWLSIREIPAERIEWVKNTSGRRYRACEKCVQDWMKGFFYIADEGNCYHHSRDCPGLKRTIHSIKYEEAAGLRPCGRCGQGGG